LVAIQGVDHELEQLFDLGLNMVHFEIFKQIGPLYSEHLSIVDVMKPVSWVSTIGDFRIPSK
ncbi:MAG: hypothetical protein AAF267_18225, partial [Deinococcota bacterium]